MRTACFWFWDSSREAYVQIRLSADTHTAEKPFVLFDRGGPTDEGHSHEVECCWIEDDLVHSLRVSRGSDCDGPYEHVSEHVCEFNNLDNGSMGCDILADGTLEEIADIRQPAWRVLSRSQRDHFAEAMGY